MNKIELLVPAGNKDAFYAAVKNGADAIYLGAKNFGARAFADNFSNDELVEIIKYAHLYGVRIYITMNTLLSEDEIENAIKEAEYLHSIGADALIIQDLGLLSECHKRYPNLELHASTQMHIHNLKSAEYIINKGVKRVVLARETSLETIKEITRKGIEVEVFAHGALCISYSGQCLISSALFNRSGNKGMCAQCCRLQYKLYDKNDDRYLNSKNEYLLSPKDLNLLDKIPELIEANISSIKIEGRMKRPEYVALVTRLYRQAIDAYYNNINFKVTDEMVHDLKLMFNRGFTHGHIYNRDSYDIYNQNRPNHIGIKVGKVIKYKNSQVFIKLDENISQGDGLRIISNGNEYGIIANKIYKNDLLVNEGLKGDIIAFNIDKYIATDSILLKTTDIKLNKTINELGFYRKIAIDIYFKALINEPLSLIVSDGKHNISVKSDYILQKAKNSPISKEKIIELLSRINDSAFYINQINGELDDIFAPIKVINELRREAISKLTILRENEKIDFIKKESCNLENSKSNLNEIIIEIRNNEQYQAIKDIKEIIVTSNDFELAKKYNLYYLNNNINESSVYKDYNLNIASELGGLSNSKIISSNVNIANSYALEFVLSSNQKGVILSSELNDYQIERLLENYFDRYNYYPNVYRHIYGKRDLMYIKKSFINNKLNKDINEEHNFELVDTKERHFNIYKNNDVTHILENEGLINKRINHCGSFIRFTDENKFEIKNILKELSII